MAASIPMSLLKPTLDTPFAIDFAWWKRYEQDWSVHLHKCLCDEHKTYFDSYTTQKTIDWIHPESAEVTQVDGLQQILIDHCSQQPDFITPQTQMVEAVFRAMLANGNLALTPRQLEEIIERPALTILRTIGGHKVYMGIRPYVQ